MVSVLQGRLLGLVGVLGLAGLLIADAVGDHFWNRHTLITSLVANLVVVAVSFGVVNEAIDRRARRRWAGLAQFVMVELARSARLTWTFLAELGGLVGESDGQTPAEVLATQRALASDAAEVTRALRGVLADPQRRTRLGEVLDRIGTASRDVIANWAAVMIGSPVYAAMFDRHVDLQTRVSWLSTLFTHYEGTDLTPARRRVASSSMAVELTQHVDDDVFLTMLVSIVELAVALDLETSALALSLVSVEEHLARTADLVSGR